MQTSIWATPWWPRRTRAEARPNGAKSRPLTHFDRDRFIYYPTPEMPEMPFAVTFQIGPDQKAREVTIEDLNDDGQGVLARVK
jgi:hypothetical protein